jgi:hypothetical protein
MANQTDSLISEVSELEKNCRKALQHDAVYKFVKGKSKAFDRLCALLDFIGDSQSALWSVSSPDKRESLEHYFLAYGLLQLMYSRQTALIDVLGIFDLTIPESFRKSAVLAPRDRTIGHPVTSDGKAHVVLRNTLDSEGFEYATYDGPNTTRGNLVRYEPLLEEHLAVMKEGLALLHQCLAKIENMRRSELRKEPLSPTLQGMSYYARCIAAAQVEEKYAEIFDTNSDGLISALEAFRDGLAKRHGLDSASVTVGPVIEGVKMLQELFPKQDERSRRRYEIVSEGVEPKVNEMIALAAEIDKTESQNLG